MLLLANGEVWTPAPIGRATVVIAGGRIEALCGAAAPGGALPFDYDVIDASNCIVAPGLIDPHAHLIGGSGEKGFASATPALTARELLASGITTVVGTLGTDTTTKTLPALLAKVKALREEGLNAWMWTGGYDARSITGSVRDDIVLIAEIIGAGEIAVGDRRGAQFSVQELARLAADCYVAGTLTGKAGVLHLHVGERGFEPSLHELLDRGIPPETLYPTHVNRNEELLRDAVELGKRGLTVDLDLVEENLTRWLPLCDPSAITISTDAPIGRPAALLEQIRAARETLGLERALALATRNTARVLKLQDAGELAPGRRADVLVLDAQSLEIRHVIAAGKVM